MEQPLRPRLHGLQRGGTAARDRLPAGRSRTAGDRHRRRPRAPDHLEPALERLPLDAGRRPGRARALGGRTAPVASSSATRARDPPRSGADLPPVLVARRRRHRARTRDRARAGGRRSAAGSSSRASRVGAAASSSCCRAPAARSDRVASVAGCGPEPGGALRSGRPTAPSPALEALLEPVEPLRRRSSSRR